MRCFAMSAFVVAYFKIMFYGANICVESDTTDDESKNRNPVLHVSNILHIGAGTFIINFYRSTGLVRSWVMSNAAEDKPSAAPHATEAVERAQL